MIDKAQAKLEVEHWKKITALLNNCPVRFEIINKETSQIVHSIPVGVLTDIYLLSGDDHLVIPPKRAHIDKAGNYTPQHIALQFNGGLPKGEDVPFIVEDVEGLAGIAEGIVWSMGAYQYRLIKDG